MQGEITDPQRPSGSAFPKIHRYHESRIGSIDHNQQEHVPTSGVEVACISHHEARSLIRAETIDEIRNLEHFPNDQELMGYMQLRQLHPEANSYRYWVEDTPTLEDHLDLELPAVAGFYSNLADFVKSNIDLISLPGYHHSSRKEDILRESLRSYFSRISQKEESFHNLINQGTCPNSRSFKEDFIFDGLMIQAKNGVHDLSQGYKWAGDLISNIDTSAAFVRYATESMANKFVDSAGKELPFHYRIYLNPRISQALEVAGQLSEQFDEENLLVMYKIMDRSYEFSKKQGRILGLRSEGIVVYCNKYHANRALEIVLECFKHNYDAFQDRPSPKLATAIAPGISVASQEGFNTIKHSFNSHRSAVIESAWEDFKSQQTSLASTIPHQDLYVFKQMLQGELRKQQIDPRNISFNDVSVSYDMV